MYHGWHSGFHHHSLSNNRSLHAFCDALYHGRVNGTQFVPWEHSPYHYSTVPNGYAPHSAFHPPPVPFHHPIPTNAVTPFPLQLDNFGPAMAPPQYYHDSVPVMTTPNIQHYHPEMVPSEAVHSPSEAVHSPRNEMGHADVAPDSDRRVSIVEVAENLVDTAVARAISSLSPRALSLTVLDGESSDTPSPPLSPSPDFLLSHVGIRTPTKQLQQQAWVYSSPKVLQVRAARTPNHSPSPTKPVSRKTIL